MSESQSIEGLLIKNTEFRVYEASSSLCLSMTDLLRKCEFFRSAIQSDNKEIAVLEFNNDLDSLAFYLSCLLEKHPLMLMSKSQMKDIASIIEGYEPKFIFSTTDHGFDGLTYDANFSFKNLFIRNKATRVSINNTTSALLLSTSGSTGSPKFVSLTLENVVSNALSISKSLSLQPNDIAITSLPLFYSYGLSVLNSHLLCGGGILLSDKSILDREFWAQINQYGVTSLAGVPYVYQMLQRLGAKEIAGSKSLRYLTQAGGKLSNPLVEFFHKLTSEAGKKFFVMYGQTEACARMSCMESSFLPKKLGSVGQAIPDGKFSILNPDPQTGAGEIIYSGPNVMLGYTTQREDLNAGDINKGSLSTGDLGYLDDEGFLYITGRLKRIAKVAGVRISLDEVEQKLSHLGSIVAITQGEKIILYTENKSIDLDQIKQTAAEALEAHPSYFMAKHIESLPLNSNGKVNYKALEG